MKDEHYDGDDQDQMNESARYVSKQANQPEKDKNDGKDEKHKILLSCIDLNAARAGSGRDVFCGEVPVTVFHMTSATAA